MKKEYDIIIIGGGATGSGIALDASLRGYRTLLLEKDDFASKASSNSSKLVHGGVRYLEKAFLQANVKQLFLVKEALKERYYLLHNCCNMSSKLPLYSIAHTIFEKLYYFVGLKLYDWLSFNKSLGSSYMTNSDTTQSIFPSLHANIQGSTSFFDGIFNDIKVNIALLQTAQHHGCDICNYHEVTDFIYNKDILSGIKVLNKHQQQYHHINAKVIINATGYFCDILRLKDDVHAKKVITFSKGSHIVLHKKYISQEHGLIFQKTSDNRVLFILPWQNHTLVGTTEQTTSFENTPTISQSEIEYLIENFNSHFNEHITQKDILSHFSSIRPLINDPKENKSENMIREHLILQSKSNLISITGGKWTTYRKMAQECLDYIIEKKLLTPLHPCATMHHKLCGNQKKITLEDLNAYALSQESKEHLIYHYGDNALALLKEFSKSSHLKPLHKDYAFIYAELLYCMKYEYVLYPNDFLFRRIAIGKVNLKITRELLSKVVEIMASYYHWSDEQTLLIYKDALKEINELLQSI